MSGTTVDAGHEAGEPDHGGAGGDHSVWYRVQRCRTTRNVELRACPTHGGATPALAAYTRHGADALLDVGTATTRAIGGDRLPRADAARASTGSATSPSTATGPAARARSR